MNKPRSPKRPFYTIEEIYNYACTCGKWFSISDDDALYYKHRVCPHCGERQAFSLHVEGGYTKGVSKDLLEEYEYLDASDWDGEKRIKKDKATGVWLTVEAKDDTGVWVKVKDILFESESSNSSCVAKLIQSSQAGPWLVVEDDPND